MTAVSTLLPNQRGAAAFEPFTTATLIVNGASMVINWMQKPPPNVQNTILQGIDNIIRQVNSISVGLNSALGALNELLVELRAMPDIIAQESYHRQVMAGYLGYTEAKRIMVRRIEFGASVADVQKDFVAETKRQYDKVGDARREAQFLKIDDAYGSLALTLCMAYAFEFEMAVTLEMDRGALTEIAENYQRWIGVILDENRPESIAAIYRSVHKNVSEVYAARQNSRPGQTIGRKSGIIDAECQKLSIFYYQSRVEVPEYTWLGSYHVWKGEGVPHGTFRGTVEDQGVLTDGQAPYNKYYDIPEVCDDIVPSVKGLDWNQVNAILDNRIKQWEEERNRWISQSIDLNSLRLRAAALEATVKACKASQHKIAAALAILNRPSAIPV